MNYSRGALKLNAFVNHLDGDATNLLSRRRRRAAAHPVLVQEHHLRRRGQRRQAPGAARHVFSYGGNVRYNAFDLSLAPRGDSRTEAGVYGAGRDLPDRALPLRGRRARRQVLVASISAVFSPRTDVHVQAGAGAHGARVVQPRLPRPVARQQLPRRRRSPTSSISARSTRRWPAASYIFPVRGDRQRGPRRRRSLNAYEIGYSGVIANRATVSAAFYVNDTEELDLLHADRVVPRHQPAARLAAAAGRARADRRRRAASVPATACRRRSAT